MPQPSPSKRELLKTDRGPRGRRIDHGSRVAVFSPRMRAFGSGLWAVRREWKTYRRRGSSGATGPCSGQRGFHLTAPRQTTLGSRIATVRRVGPPAPSRRQRMYADAVADLWAMTLELSPQPRGGDERRRRVGNGAAVSSGRWNLSGSGAVDMAKDADGPPFEERYGRASAPRTRSSRTTRPHRWTADRSRMMIPKNHNVQPHMRVIDAQRPQPLGTKRGFSNRGQARTARSSRTCPCALSNPLVARGFRADEE